MDFLTIIEQLLNSNKVSGTVVSVSVTLLCAGVGVYYLGKFALYVHEHFKKKTADKEKERNEELHELKLTFQKDNQYVVKFLEDLADRLKTIESKSEEGLGLGKQLENELDRLKESIDAVKTAQEDGGKIVVSVEHEMDSLVSDSKEQYAEITRQLQYLQKDLASLHGTIIGLNTQRSRLK